MKKKISVSYLLILVLLVFCNIFAYNLLSNAYDEFDKKKEKYVEVIDEYLDAILSNDKERAELVSEYFFSRKNDFSIYSDNVDFARQEAIEDFNLLFYHNEGAILICEDGKTYITENNANDFFYRHNLKLEDFYTIPLEKFAFSVIPYTLYDEDGLYSYATPLLDGNENFTGVLVKLNSFDWVLDSINTLNKEYMHAQVVLTSLDDDVLGYIDENGITYKTNSEQINLVRKKISKLDDTRNVYVNEEYGIKLYVFIDTVKLTMNYIVMTVLLIILGIVQIILMGILIFLEKYNVKREATIISIVVIVCLILNFCSFKYSYQMFEKDIKATSLSIMTKTQEMNEIACGIIINTCSSRISQAINAAGFLNKNVNYNDIANFINTVFMDPSLKGSLRAGKYGDLFYITPNKKYIDVNKHIIRDLTEIENDVYEKTLLQDESFKKYTYFLDETKKYTIYETIKVNLKGDEFLITGSAIDGFMQDYKAINTLLKNDKQNEIYICLNDEALNKVYTACLVEDGTQEVRTLDNADFKDTKNLSLKNSIKNQTKNIEYKNVICNDNHIREAIVIRNNNSEMYLISTLDYEGTYRLKSISKTFFVTIISTIIAILAISKAEEKYKKGQNKKKEIILHNNY